MVVMVAALGHKCICKLLRGPPPLLRFLDVPKLASPATHKFFEPCPHPSDKFPEIDSLKIGRGGFCCS